MDVELQDERRVGAPRSWVVVLASFSAAVAVAAFAGGWLIGLSPAFVAPLVATPIAAVAIIGRRRNRRQPIDRGALRFVVAQLTLAGAVTLVLAQAVPYGRAHSNPRVTGEPAWSSPRTRELMVNACFGCHSNEVKWPWYSNIAPISWAVTAHVDDGRAAVNYSEFATNPGEAENLIEVIQNRSMPPDYYTRFGLHPEARLSDAEIAELIAGIRATPGLSGGGGGERGG